MDVEAEKKKRKEMRKPVEAKQEEFTVANIAQFITEELGISETMLAGLLDITSRTLDNWKKFNFPEELTDKAKRIKALYEFVTLAKKSKVKSSEILSLLTESIDPDDEASESPIFYIVQDPGSKSFVDFSKLAIQNFLK